jgi:xanthine dehydrogenase YagR molybdenum-binding subunit
MEFSVRTGICGTDASLANAIYNAFGARVRDYPITLDKLLSALPTQT